MKKIVFVIESLNHGGAEKSLVSLLNHVDFSNFKVDLILFQKKGEFIKFVPKDINIIHKEALKKISFFSRIKFILLKTLKDNHHSAQLFWKTYNKQTPQLKKTYDIAIAYNQGFSTYYVATKIKALKKISWLNTDYNKAGYNANFDLFFYKKYNHIITVSNESKNIFLSSFKNLNLNVKINVIKDMINSKNIKSLSNKNNNIFNNSTTNILTIGRLADAKGYPLAIKAARLLLNKGYDFNWYVIGEGNKRTELERLIKQEKVQNNFHLLGYKENPYPYIKECDIYVQTSLFEGLGLTVIEATIFKKPIVCTNFSTAQSIITHNKTGLICKMTPESIVTSIKKYIDNPDLAQKVTKNLQNQTNNDTEVSLQKINNLLGSK